MMTITGLELATVLFILVVGVILIKAGLRRNPLNLLDESVLYSRVLPFDVDIALVHMNNARVLREFDFGRWDLCARTGLFKHGVVEKVPSFFVGAQVVRYRKPLHLFMKYKITSKIVYWEGNIVYFEHKIITIKDNIVRSMGYGQGYVLFKIDDFVEKHQPGLVKPEAPTALNTWMKFIQETKVKPDMESGRKIMTKIYDKLSK